MLDPEAGHGASTDYFTSANMDVQLHIMSHLSTADLSALMRTSRYFLDVALRPLCDRSGQPIRDGVQATSFYEFLRIDSGLASARKLLIKELRFCLPYEPPAFDYHGRPVRAVHTNAFLGILHHCRNLQRLRIDCWFKSVPSSLLVHTISTTLVSLNELTIGGRHHLDGKALRKLVRLPLRKFALLKCQLPTRLGPPVPTYSMVALLQPLACTLVELEMPHLDQPDGTVFPNVRKLAVRVKRSEGVVDMLAAAFPNLTHLTIGSVDSHDCFRSSKDKTVRASNKKLWETRYKDLWPALQVVGAHDVCAAFCLGLTRSVPCVSLPAESRAPSLLAADTLTPTILSWMQPGVVKLRIRMSHHAGDLLDGLGLVAPRGEVRPCRLILELDSEDSCPNDRWIYMTGAALDALRRGTSAVHCTHILLEYVSSGEKIERELATPLLSDLAAQVRSKIVPAWLPLLRYTGVDVWGWGSRWWEVTRRTSGGSGQDLLELDEGEGRRIMKAEGLMYRY